MRARTDTIEYATSGIDRVSGPTNAGSLIGCRANRRSGNQSDSYNCKIPSHVKREGSAWGYNTPVLQ